MRQSFKHLIIRELLRSRQPDLATAMSRVVVAKDAPPLKSKTGMRLREDLGGLPQFASFTDDNWVHFGNHVKKYGDTRIVFTGALQALLAHALRKGKALPMTVDYGVRWVPRDSFAMKTQYHDRYLGWLEDAGIVEKTTMSAKDALKVQHTKRDEAAAKENPQQQVEVYVAGDTLPGIIALMQKYGAKMSAQGRVGQQAATLPRQEKDMNRQTRREIVATLVRQGRRDLAERFVGAGWKDEGDNVHILQTVLKGKDALGKPKKRNIVLRIDGRDGTWRVDYLGMMGNVWEAIDNGQGFKSLSQAKKYAAKWKQAYEQKGDLPSPRDVPR
jgi:hypothetical protein